MTGQIGLFDGVKLEEPEPMTTVRVGSRVAQIPLKKKRRKALARLMEILAELEGKDIYIGSYHAGGSHFWIDNLKLPRLRLEYYPIRVKDDASYIPGVVVLWGNRSASVRIFTDYLIDIREQEYQGYWRYLIDFYNGTWESPIDNYRCHYACLHITRFKD